MRGGLATVGALVAMSLSVHATAQSWPAKEGFVVRGASDGCLVASFHEVERRPGVSLFLFWRAEGYSLELGSAGWSTAPSGTALRFEFNRPDGSTLYALESYVEPARPSGGEQGFVAAFDDEAVSAFARASSMTVTKGDTVIASLDLAGSQPAIDRLRQCKDVVGNRIAAARQAEQLHAHIPLDPFAPPSTTELGVRWSRSPVVTARDTPQRAIDSGVDGKATVECTISDAGRPEACRIVAENPAGYGFGQAAVRVIQRAQASPSSVGLTQAFTISFEVQD